MGRESKIEEKVCEYAEEQHLQQRKLCWIGRKDAPDRIFWGHGILPFVIEFKAPGEEPRPGQMRELNAIASSGLYAYVCDSVEYGKKIIDAHITQHVKL